MRPAFWVLVVGLILACTRVLAQQMGWGFTGWLLLFLGLIFGVDYGWYWWDRRRWDRRALLCQTMPAYGYAGADYPTKAQCKEWFGEHDND